MLTQAEVQTALPASLKSAVSQELVDTLNGICTDEEIARTVRDNLLSYTAVLKEGKFKVEDYVNAVAYVSFKMMGYSNQESYVRTFPARYQTLVARGATDKDISAYVAAFAKNKLVNIILEQSLIPIWVLNQDVYQAAINKQVWLMKHAKREDVQQKAADSLLNHLKKPEAAAVQLNLNMADNSGLNELREQLGKMAEMQKDLIQAGMKTKEIAHQSIVDAEVLTDTN
jgi:predicted lipid carrier protein YhbT